MYVLPNRIEFLDWIHNTYHPKKYEDSGHPYQDFVKDFINKETPYSGLLLYHGLGTGKTKSSLDIINNFVNGKINKIINNENFEDIFKKVFIILPASLERNYKNEILKHTKIRLLKKNILWTKVYSKDKTFNIPFKPKKLRNFFGYQIIKN